MRRSIAVAGAAFALALLAAAAWTWSNIRPFSDELRSAAKSPERPVFLDRHGERLNITYENRWNVYDQIRLHDVPEFLQNAVILSEDRHFYTHDGVDWPARLHALWQNLVAFRAVRGASTISEQVVRMIRPRPRTVASRWIEGFEAISLEKAFSKPDILEFYLNQVPYRARRRGVVQAARYYFDRDIDTLNGKEMLALAVLIRSPRWFDPSENRANIDRSVADLLQRMYRRGYVDETTYENIRNETLELKSADLDLNARHFLEYVTQSMPADRPSPVHTTLDAPLQRSVQKMLDTRLDRLSRKHVGNAAVLIVDHHTNEIRAWVVGYAGDETKAFSQMNPVLIRRQPGSALKPFLYAKAIEMGWNAATMIDDAPLEEGVGMGMHVYHNYSRTHYGPISVREALGNSLNIPAVKTIQYVGTAEFLEHLDAFGIRSLSKHPNVYGDGIALGNGEVTLLELTRAYTVLARMGDFKALDFLEGSAHSHPGRRVFSEEIASLVADILSDPAARAKEFGWNSVLNLPHQTAVKTGTSTDYRDAWAMGYDDRHTVGVWFGNLDYSAMEQITGSTGPADLLRSVFNELNRNRPLHKLYLSPRLRMKKICIADGSPEHDGCESKDELFLAEREPSPAALQPTREIRFRKPSNGLLLASDPRIPDANEYFAFELTAAEGIEKIEWYVNSRLAAVTPENSYHWKVEKGAFTASARVWLKGVKQPLETPEVAFSVQ